MARPTSRRPFRDGEASPLPEAPTPTPEAATAPPAAEPVIAPPGQPGPYVPPNRVNARFDNEIRNALVVLADRLGTHNTSAIIRAAVMLAEERTRDVPQIITRQAYRDGFSAGVARVREQLMRSLSEEFKDTE